MFARHVARRWAWPLAAGLLHLPVAGQEPGPRPGSAVVSGSVVAGDSGAPISAVSVELLTLDSVRVSSAITDDAGRFRLDRVPEGDFRLLLSTVGYAAVYTASFRVARGEERDLGLGVRPGRR